MAGYLAPHGQSALCPVMALVNGYATATAWGSVIMVLGALPALAMISAGKPARGEPDQT